jgi:hypothetical protein
MTITISQATESLLMRRAEEQGATADDLADMILFRSLSEVETDEQADIDAIREAIVHEQQGKYRLFSEYVANHDLRYPRHSS